MRAQTMRLIVGLLLIAALAGCVSDETPEGFTPTPFPLEVFRHAWAGSDVHVPGAEHGIVFTIHNPTERDVSMGIFLEGTSDVLLGPIAKTSGSSPVETWLGVRIEGNETRGVGTLVPAGASTMIIGKVTSYDSSNISARFLASDPIDPEILYHSTTISWEVTVAAGAAVDPTMLVQTRTVGLWTNGTSFYTNSADLLADPAFPAGGNVNRAEGTATLPIYVFNSTRAEQPLGNADNCYFTTIPGYNGLIKRQYDLSTSVTIMQPSQGYTVVGNEGHLLYGDTLVFLNTIVAIDGQTTTEDEIPDPTGACFDPLRATQPAQALLPV